MATIRRAGTDDRAAVAAMVAAAFAEDPAWAFLLGADYERLAPLFATALFDVRVGSGTVWVAADGAAVAMWDAPGDRSRSRAESERIWGEFGEAAGAQALRRLDTYERALDAVKPDGSYWYLGVLATHPHHRRIGLAQAVMSPGIEQADAAGLDCCLETSTAANRAFYERRGFADAVDVTIDAGPPTWWLRRPPAG